MKHLVLNLVFTHCLTRQTRLVNGLEENSDNEDLADELVDLKLDGNDLLAAIQTHVRGSGLQHPAPEEAAESQEAGSEAGNLPEHQAAPTRLYDMTMHMFGLSGAIWQQEDGIGNAAGEQRHEEMLRSAAEWDIDRDLALAAAKASGGSTKKEAASTGLIGELEPEVEAGGSDNMILGVYPFKGNLR